MPAPNSAVELERAAMKPVPNAAAILKPVISSAKPMTKEIISAMRIMMRVMSLDRLSKHPAEMHTKMTNISGFDNNAAAGP